MKTGIIQYYKEQRPIPSLANPPFFLFVPSYRTPVLAPSAVICRYHVLILPSLPEDSSNVQLFPFLSCPINHVQHWLNVDQRLIWGQSIARNAYAERLMLG